MTDFQKGDYIIVRGQQQNANPTISVFIECFNDTEIKRLLISAGPLKEYGKTPGNISTIHRGSYILLARSESAKQAARKKYGILPIPEWLR